MSGGVVEEGPDSSTHLNPKKNEACFDILE
jgi:hypothetical protein